ncbi:MAG: stage 0 sporulation family protein [Sedimentisphaeraceae bacterium JB056]
MENKKSKNTKKMLVKYGKMGYLGWFSHNELNLPPAPKKVIIKTDRGLEMGEMIGTGCYKHGNFKGCVNNLPEYFDVGPNEYPVGFDGKFVRFATHQDLNEARHVRESANDELKICRRYVKEHGLHMKVVDFEHIFGGERIVFYFVSDGRVDFRDLVKQLAKEFQTRIEMRQIGARDEARLISDIETCGQQCCCSKFLKILKPVNMRMAKTQKATLDPSKISGHCGRLRCCLRYEDKTYQELKNDMPNRQSWVSTPSGEGRVIDYQILTQLVHVYFEDGQNEAIPLDQIKVLPDGPTQKEQPKQEEQPKERKSSNNSDQGKGGNQAGKNSSQRNAQGSDNNSSDKKQGQDGSETADNNKKQRKRRRRRKPSKENDNQKKNRNNRNDGPQKESSSN